MKITDRRTLESRMLAANYRPSGFDYMRFVLAILVVCIHSLDVTDRALINGLWHSPYRSLMALVLPMFFCLSGFLVAGSLARCRSIISFGGLRVLRLVPALAVDTLISALLLGPIFTSLPLAEYLSSSIFHAYFLNIVGDIHFLLPGVFAGHPLPNIVNMQLWTLPYELRCYLAIILLSFVGIAQRPRLFLPFVILLNVVMVVRLVVWQKGGTAGVTVPGDVLVLCFLYGIAAYYFRTKILWSHRLFVVALVGAAFCLGYGGTGNLLCALPVTYVTVYLGLLQPKRSIVVASGDYSYGIFLYGFPVQQAVVAMFGAGQHWTFNLAVALPITVLFAMFSWHCVEKPTLKLRPKLINLEDASLRLASLVPWGRFFVPSLGIRNAVSS